MNAPAQMIIPVVVGVLAVPFAVRLTPHVIRFFGRRAHRFMIAMILGALVMLIAVIACYREMQRGVEDWV